MNILRAAARLALGVPFVWLGRVQFLKNLGLIGGLLAVAATPHGGCRAGSSAE